MKVAIGFVVYVTKRLHWDFMLETVKSVRSAGQVDRLAFINAMPPEYESEVLYGQPCTIIGYSGAKPISVAAAWNHLIRQAFKARYDYLIIANTDLVFHPDAIDNLVFFAQDHLEYALWTAAQWNDLRTLSTAEPGTEFDEHPHFSCFALTRKTVKDLEAWEKKHKRSEPYPGLFDENFVGAYMEDLDYHQRLLRAGMKAAKTSSAWFYHYGSRTIKCDPELERTNLITHQQNRDYFAKKWGYQGDGKAL